MRIDKMPAQVNTPILSKTTGVKPQSESRMEPVVQSDSFNASVKGVSIDDFKEALAVKPKIFPDQDGKEIKTKQYADSYGRVKHLALQLSSYVYGNSRSQVLNAYKTLFQNMEPDTKFTVVVESDRDRSDVEKVIKDNNIQNPDRIDFIKPNVGSLTVWARDEMVGMYLPDDPKQSPALLNQTTLHYWHNNDAKVPPFIAEKHPGIVLDKEPRIVTDGGDTTSNRNESYVGYKSYAATVDNLHKMTGRDASAKQKMIAYYENKYGKEVVESNSDNPFAFRIVPKKYPADIHKIPFKVERNPDYKPEEVGPGQVREAQMYEDLAKELFEKQFGKPVNVMGMDDPNTAHHEQPASDHMDMGMTPVDEKTFTLGSPALAQRIFRSMSPGELEQAESVLSKATGKPIDLKKMLSSTRIGDSEEDFNAYEKKFQKDGYRVVRLPHAEPGWGSPYISYNNCLMERWDKNGDGTEYRRIFLPIYGIEKLDNYAIKAYEKEGFEVIPMRLDSLATKWGALRCISNWLERSPQG